jgi:hypothetical protein
LPFGLVNCARRLATGIAAVSARLESRTHELPGGRLKLLDGHLRRDLDPNMEVDVEILDVNDDEARALLLSIDPLASLAQTQEQLRNRLLELTPTPNADLQAAWEATMNPLLAQITQPEPPWTEGPARAVPGSGGRAAMRSIKSNCWSDSTVRAWSARRCCRRCKKCGESKGASRHDGSECGIHDRSPVRAVVGQPGIPLVGD